LQRYIEQKVGTGESVPWTQQQIDKGFTGCSHRHDPSFLVIASNIFAALLPSNILDLEVLPTKQFVYLALDDKHILVVLLFSVFTLTILCHLCLPVSANFPPNGAAIENMIKGCAGKYATGDEVQLVRMLPYNSVLSFFLKEHYFVW
jgi:hypothetical protein